MALQWHCVLYDTAPMLLYFSLAVTGDVAFCVCVAVCKWSLDVRQLFVTPASWCTLERWDTYLPGLSVWDQSYVVQSQSSCWEGHLRAAGTVPVLRTLAATVDAAKTWDRDVPGQVRWPMPRPHRLAIVVWSTYGIRCVLVIWLCARYLPCQVVECHICQCLCSRFAAVVTPAVHDVIHFSDVCSPALQSCNTYQPHRWCSFVVNIRLMGSGGQWTAYHRALLCVLLCLRLLCRRKMLTMK